MQQLEKIRLDLRKSYVRRQKKVTEYWLEQTGEQPEPGCEVVHEYYIYRYTPDYNWEVISAPVTARFFSNKV